MIVEHGEGRMPAVPRRHRARTAAAIPNGRVIRPSSLSPDGLTVAFIEEGGERSREFHFAHVEAPLDLLRPLVAAFASITALTGTYRRISSAEKAASILRRFAREVAAAYPGLTSIEELDPIVWRWWSGILLSETRSNSTLEVVRALLRGAIGVPPATLKELNISTFRRFPPLPSYSRAELARILSAARHVDAGTRSRLRDNHEALSIILGGGQPFERGHVVIRGERWSDGAILNHLHAYGQMPRRYAVPRSESLPLRQALGVGDGPFITALYPTRAEIHALMIMFVYHTGFNLSVLSNLRVTDAQIVSAPATRRPIYTVSLDKPRRGRTRRHSSVTLVGKAARLWERTVKATQPIRDKLADLGEPTDRLFLAVAGSKRKSHLGGLFIDEWMSSRASRAWHERETVYGDDGAPLRVTLQRLRRTEQVLNGESRQNTPEESEDHYRKNDPQTIERASETILTGQKDAVDHAHLTVARRITSDQMSATGTDPGNLAEELGMDRIQVQDLLDGALDTATAGCLDVMHSPHPEDHGGECTASFLQCLGCPVAVVTPMHLPRLEALLEALLSAARSTPDTKRTGLYDVHIARLNHLLGQVPKPERGRARHAVTPEDIEVIERLLARELDA